MYTNLGLHWAASIPAFLSVACIPFPIIFYIYGAKIRAKCKFAAEAARVLEEMRGRAGTTAEDPEAAEDEAMEEVQQSDRMEKLVKKMSRASGKSRTRGLSRVESGAAGPATEPAHKEVDNEKVEV